MIILVTATALIVNSPTAGARSAGNWYKKNNKIPLYSEF